jgi:hypothetical protein
MSYIISALILVLLCVAGCTAPTYLSLPPADPSDPQYRGGLFPSLPDQAIVRDQHLGQLQADMRYLEEAVLRAEQNRLQTCRAPEASQVDSVAYQRCQLRDQIYQQLTAETAMARDRYLGAISGRGATSR